MLLSSTLQLNNIISKIADLAAEDTPQLYVACGRGPRSTLRVLRHGLEVRLRFFSSIVILMMSDLTGHRNGSFRITWQP